MLRGATNCGVDLPRLLEDAVPLPSYVQTENGGALLALAAHCIMVNEGFVPLAKARTGASIFSPPEGWNSCANSSDAAKVGSILLPLFCDVFLLFSGRRALTGADCDGAPLPAAHRMTIVGNGSLSIAMGRRSSL